MRTELGSVGPTTPYLPQLSSHPPEKKLTFHGTCGLRTTPLASEGAESAVTALNGWRHQPVNWQNPRSPRLMGRGISQ
jgi:hypothetical protein